MTKKIVIARGSFGNKKIQYASLSHVSVENIATLSSSIVHELKNYLAAISISAELSENKLKNIRQKIKT